MKLKHLKYLLIFLSLNCWGQNKNTAIIDSILNSTFPRGFNGAILFTSNDSVVFKNNYGYSNFKKNIPLNDSSVFDLASCAKQFTAVAILKLQEMGKLSVSDSLRKFFPELPYNNVTIKQLLTHTSGIPDYVNLLQRNKIKMGAFLYNADLISYYSKEKIKADFPSGKKYRYSNTAYAFLASIIEKASGMSYGDFLKKYIFEPLGMNHTLVYNTRWTKGETIPNYAYGYIFSKKDKKYYLPDTIKDYSFVVSDCILGPKGVNTTIMDLIKWDKALLNNTVLTMESINDAYTFAKTNSGEEFNYGYGVGIETQKDIGKIISHMGGIPGYHSIIYRLVDKRKMLVILSNKFSESDDLWSLAQKISGLFLNNK